MDLSAEYIVDNNLAGAMSESYGECELVWGLRAINISLSYGSKLLPRE